MSMKTISAKDPQTLEKMLADLEVAGEPRLLDRWVDANGIWWAKIWDEREARAGRGRIPYVIHDYNE